MRVLITGIVGSLAQLVADALIAQGHQVFGVDYRKKPELLRPEITFVRANYNKTRIEDVFRKHQPEAVLHLGRVGNLKETSNKRFDLNVVGSAKIMELCVKYNAKRLLVLSTFHIYGAHPANHIRISEEEPLRAVQNFPQLMDAVQLDTMATTWVYKHRKLRTIVLRPCNVVGPRINNAISNYLRAPTHLSVLGFNPMWQFVHERDMVSALLKALESDAIGVFNVAGSGEIPIQDAQDSVGGRTLVVPGLVADFLLRVRGRVGKALPPYLLDFFKYPCVVSDQKFRSEVGYAPQVSLRETLRSVAGVA